MPRGDRRGPAGYGPMTGRGAGFCAGYPVPGHANPVPVGFCIRGRGFGFYGRARGYGFYGRGRGYRHQFYATGLPFWAGNTYPVQPAPDYFDKYIPEDEAKALSREAEFLKQELKAIEERLNQLEEAKKENPDKNRDRD
jgi:hypothetical protein